MAFVSASDRETRPARVPAFEVLGGGRVSVWVDERRIEIVSRNGTVREYHDHSVFEETGPLVDAVALDGSTVLLGRRCGERLYCFDMVTGSAQVVPLPERLVRAESLRVHATSDGYLVITENGIVAIDPSGQVRWQVDEVTFGWRLVASMDGVHWLEDTGGDVVGFEATSGSETDR